MAAAPTMKDIAQQLGVHKSTVQRALAGDRRLEAATIARVQAAALSLRRSGRRPATRQVALFFPPRVFTSAYFMRLLSGVMDELSDHGQDLVTSFLVREQELRLPACVRRGEIDAALALGHPDSVAGLAAALAAVADGVPLVSLVNPAAGAAVVADVAAGAALAMERLLALGHRRLLAFEGLAHRDQARLTGWRRALAAHGLDPDRHLRVERVGAEPDGLAAAFARACTALPGATAILAPNDPTAVALARLLTARGLAVPGDFSLVGFDDSDPLPDALGANRLTSLAVPLERLGREGARLALDLAAGGAPRTVVLPVEWRERASIAAPGA
ncbi:MAG: LacI family transcriptional regulator [Planctomycetes bacterium]|nr:LacI family transcriptional regulator [Planctomycetota bacterium]